MNVMVLIPALYSAAPGVVIILLVLIVLYVNGGGNNVCQHVNWCWLSLITNKTQIILFKFFSILYTHRIISTTTKQNEYEQVFLISDFVI